MDATLVTLLLVGVLSVLFLYYLLTRKENRYPPGPFAFPILGNLPQILLASSLTKFAELNKKKYGNVSAVKSLFSVSLTSYILEVIRLC